MAQVFQKTIAKKSLDELNQKLINKIVKKDHVTALVVHDSKEELKLQRYKVGRDSFSVVPLQNKDKIGFFKCKFC